MTSRRIFKWLAFLAGLCIILFLTAVLLLPRVVDSQAVREKIRTFLLSRISGDVAIENIDLTWFPRPTAIVRGVAFTFGDTVNGTVQSMEVHPSLKSLFTGQLSVSSLLITAPVLTVQLPEPDEFNTDKIETNVRSAITAIAAQVPGLVVTIRDGTARIKIGNRPEVMITDFGGRLRAPPDNMDLQITSRANLFDSLRIEGKISGETLATNGRINIENLRLRESLAAVSSHPPDTIGSGIVNLNVGLTSTGLKKIKTDINGTLPSLGLVRGSKKTVIEGSTFKAVVSRDDGSVNAVIDRLDLTSPHLTATGELTVDPGSSAVSLKLVGRDLDVSRVRASALEIADDIKIVTDIFRHVRGGQMSEISLQATGRSFDELWKANNIVVAGSLRNGNISTVVLDLDLADVNGSFVVSNGILET